MPAFAFDKILKIIQIVLTVLQAALAAFTGVDKVSDVDSDS